MHNLKSLPQYTYVALFIGLLWFTACAIPPEESEHTSVPRTAPGPAPTSTRSGPTAEEAEEVSLDADEVVDRMVRSFDEASSYGVHGDMYMPHERMISDCVRAHNNTTWCSHVRVPHDSGIGRQTDIFIFQKHAWIRPDSAQGSWVFAQKDDIETGYGGPNSLELIERVEEVTPDMMHDQPVYRIELEYNAQLLLEQLIKTSPDVDAPFQSNQGTTAEGTILVDVETFLPLLEQFEVYNESSSSEPTIQMEIRYEGYDEVEELSFMPVAEELYRVANDFTAAMRRGDYEAAREYFSSRAQEEVSISALETFANTNPTLFGEYDISGASVESQDTLDDLGLQGPFQILLLEMDAGEGGEQFLRFVFEQEADNWKLVRFDEMKRDPL
jgi:hypothetical protein